jgi:hypothetical protein
MIKVAIVISNGSDMGKCLQYIISIRALTLPPAAPIPPSSSAK